MVEFEYQPWKKIVVHEVVKYPIEFFLSQHSLGIPQPYAAVEQSFLQLPHLWHLVQVEALENT